MFIVLDSTVFWDDPNVKSGAWALLREFTRRSDSTVFIPQVVLDEVEANLGKRFDETMKEVKNALQSLARLIDGEYKVPEPDRSQEMARYSKRFRSRLGELKIQRLSYPSISHPELVKRQVNHQRPFQAKGTGYRDALIWHSLLELLEGSKEECVLVTKNSTDFATSKESPTIIHADLQKDLNAGGIEAKVSISKDLDAFLDERAKPSLKRLDALKKDLENGKPVDLRNELRSRLKQILEEIEQNATRLLRLRRYDFRRLEEPIGISWLDEEPTDLHIDDVLEFIDQHVYLEFTGEYEAEIFGYLPHIDAYNLRRDSALVVTDWNWNDYYVQVSAYVTLRISFRAVLDLKKNKIIDFGVKEVNTDEDRS
jgi:PIN domain